MNTENTNVTGSSRGLRISDERLVALLALIENPDCSQVAPCAMCDHAAALRELQLYRSQDTAKAECTPASIP